MGFLLKDIKQKGRKKMVGSLKTNLNRQKFLEYQNTFTKSQREYNEITEG